jgi:microcystin-dependent protein
MEGFLGEIRLFGGNFAPKNWMFCDGQLIQVSKNTILYSLLGNIYGGKKDIDFNLPDMKGKIIVGTGSNFKLGSTGGVPDIVLSEKNLPPHTHPTTITSLGAEIFPPATPNPPDTEFPKDAYPAEASMEAYNKSTTVPMQSISASVAEYTMPTTDAGVSYPIQLYSPSLTLSYIICVSGPYPLRN